VRAGPGDDAEEIWSRLKQAASRLAVDEQRSEDLPMLAAEALAEGVDSPALRMAAGTPASEVRDARDWFVAALDELGIPIPDTQASLYAVVLDLARSIVDGDVPPYTGARRIWELSYRVEREGDLRIFIGLASEREDHPDSGAAIDRRIIEEARVLLGRPELRRWVKVSAVAGAWPLWEPRQNRNLESDELAISGDLRHDLEESAATFDQVQEHPGPGPSGFATQADAQRFVALGRDLVERLQQELGDGWHVEYMPTASAFPRSS